MQKVAQSSKPFGDLFSRIIRTEGLMAQGADGNSRKALQDAAQLALEIEFTTIPPYLTALYSISDTASTAYQTLRSVVMEEMFHVNQAANLLVGIGGRPSFTKRAPVYPCYLPHSNTARMPFIGLCRASTQVFENTFAAIEMPAPEQAPAQGDAYDTIAQVYKALRDGLKNYRDITPLYQAEPGMRQRLDIYLGKFGGEPKEVKDFNSADEGIEQIVQQGEGFVPNNAPMIPLNPWGAYNYYGQRTDGTYGPIMGTPYEMSHFRKFRAVALDVANFPATYPIVSNPHRSEFLNPVALKLAETFDIAYSMMLDAMEQSFVVQPPGERDPFFSTALPLMHHTLPKLARQLMTTPLYSDGDKTVGPTAAPTFLYQPGGTTDQLAASITQAHDVVLNSVASRAERDALMQTLGSVREDVGQLAAGAAPHVHS